MTAPVIAPFNIQELGKKLVWLRAEHCGISIEALSALLGGKPYTVETLRAWELDEYRGATPYHIVEILQAMGIRLECRMGSDSAEEAEVTQTV